MISATALSVLVPNVVIRKAVFDAILDADAARRAHAKELHFRNTMNRGETRSDPPLRKQLHGRRESGELADRILLEVLRTFREASGRKYWE